jgi:hypothetical protein
MASKYSWSLSVLLAENKLTKKGNLVPWVYVLYPNMKWILKTFLFRALFYGYNTTHVKGIQMFHLVTVSANNPDNNPPFKRRVGYFGLTGN